MLIILIDTIFLDTYIVLTNISKNSFSFNLCHLIYYLLKIFTGLVFAACQVCKLVVSKAIISAKTPTARKIHKLSAVCTVKPSSQR